MLRMAGTAAVGLGLAIGLSGIGTVLGAQAPDTIRVNSAAEQRRAELMRQQEERRRLLERQRAGIAPEAPAPSLRPWPPAPAWGAPGAPNAAFGRATGGFHPPFDTGVHPFLADPLLWPDGLDVPGFGFGDPFAHAWPFPGPPGAFRPGSPFDPWFPGFHGVPIVCSGFVSFPPRMRPFPFPRHIPRVPGPDGAVAFLGTCRVSPFTGFGHPSFSPFGHPFLGPFHDFPDPFFGPFPGPAPFRPGRPEHRFRQRFPISDAEPGVPGATVPAVGWPGGWARDAAWNDPAGACMLVRIRTVTGAEYVGGVRLPAYGIDGVHDVALAIEAELARGNTVTLLGAHGYPVHVPPSIFVDAVEAEPCGASRAGVR